ncbi:MAG: rhodanese-like domain-containing protein [Burkholderiales bacterium]|jgi:rhodanese-related sulfurtransferase
MPSTAPTPDSRPALDAAEVLDRATARGRAADRPYRGDVTPAEAWVLHRAGAARLVDVRTQAEWTYVGRVDGTPLVEWRALGAQQPNPRFVEQLEQAVPRDLPVMFLCRSGVRSQAAAKAASEAGWTAAFNILEGFEGDLDDAQQRGRLGGWRHAGLPWVQS